MGYDTYFTIRMEGPEEAKSKVIKEFRKMDTPGFFIQHAKDDYEAQETLNAGFEAHWYDAEEDCKKIARKNPDVLIIVNGAGEDRDDIWEARFKGKLFEEAKAIVKGPDITDRRLFDENERIALGAADHPHSAFVDMAKAKELLRGITRSGYIPFASPSPSHTELVVRNSVLTAIAMLDKALIAHESLYGKNIKNGQ